MAHSYPTIDEIADAVRDLDNYTGPALIQQTRKLVTSVASQLAALADAATFEMTRDTTQQAVADAIGVSRSQVENAVTRHLRRVRAGAVTR